MVKPEIEMVFVKGGCFQMGDTFGDGYGDEKPIHEVCVGDFYIGKFPVTQKQWQKVMGNKPSYFKGDELPVEQVSWDDVQEFITKLNRQTGKAYRLPTEAEWEYAARSGGKAEKWAGANIESELSDYAWGYENSGRKTHPVGQKKPNGLGLYDMAGNVCEWVQDWYDKDYYKKSPKGNPKGPKKGTVKALRGGSRFGKPQTMRTTDRFWNEPTERLYCFGFRLTFPAL